jgi:hypothetical protein
MSSLNLAYLSSNGFHFASHGSFIWQVLPRTNLVWHLDQLMVVAGRPALMELTGYVIGIL